MKSLFIVTVHGLPAKIGPMEAFQLASGIRRVIAEIPEFGISKKNINVHYIPDSPVYADFQIEETVDHPNISILINFSWNSGLIGQDVYDKMAEVPGKMISLFQKYFAHYQIMCVINHIGDSKRFAVSS